MALGNERRDTGETQARPSLKLPAQLSARSSQLASPSSARSFQSELDCANLAARSRLHRFGRTSHLSEASIPTDRPAYHDDNNSNSDNNDNATCGSPKSLLSLDGGSAGGFG